MIILYELYELYEFELKVGIFARRAMVDQARQGLCYQKET